MGFLRQIRENKFRSLRVIPESGVGLSALRTPYEGYHKEYIDPDSLYQTRGAMAFIYTTDGTIYYGNNSHTTHYQIIGQHPELISRYRLYSYYKRRGIPMAESVEVKSSPEVAHSNYVDGSADIADIADVSDTSSVELTHSDGRVMEPRDVALNMGDLLGRIGRYNKLVSFWNSDPDDYNTHLKPCLEQLIDDGQLDPDGEVSTPNHGIVPMQDALGGAEGRALTPEEEERLELHKQLHLMRGEAKKQAMKKLGVGGGGKPHAMATAMSKAGLLTPGQKWWTPHSESFNRRLSGILDGL